MCCSMPTGAGEAYGQVPLDEAVKNNPTYQPVFMENNVLLLRRVKA